MDSPDRLRLLEIGLRMIVDLLPHLGDRPIPEYRLGHFGGREGRYPIVIPVWLLQVWASVELKDGRDANGRGKRRNL